MRSTLAPTAPSSTATLPKGLNVRLWVLQVLLACFFVMVGYSVRHPSRLADCG